MQHFGPEAYSFDIWGSYKSLRLLCVFNCLWSNNILKFSKKLILKFYFVLLAMLGPLKTFKALDGLLCADMSWRNYSRTHSAIRSTTKQVPHPVTGQHWPCQFCPDLLHNALAIWLSGNVVGHINEVTLCRAGLVLRWVTVHRYTILLFDQASLVIPSWVGEMSTSDGYGYH